MTTRAVCRSTFFRRAAADGVAGADRTARLRVAGKAVDVALPADSVTSLTWR